MSEDENDAGQKAMQREEDKLRKQSESEGNKKRREQEKRKWEKHQGDDSMKDLDWFLSRSQVGYLPLLGCCIVAQFFGLTTCRVFLPRSWTS